MLLFVAIDDYFVSSLYLYLIVFSFMATRFPLITTTLRALILEEKENSEKINY